MPAPDCSQRASLDASGTPSVEIHWGSISDGPLGRENFELESDAFRHRRTSKPVSPTGIIQCDPIRRILRIRSAIALKLIPMKTVDGLSLRSSSYSPQSPQRPPSRTQGKSRTMVDVVKNPLILQRLSWRHFCSLTHPSFRPPIDPRRQTMRSRQNPEPPGETNSILGV